MDMIARHVIRIDVPFEANIDSLGDIPDFNEFGDDEEKRTKARNKLEQDQRKIDEQRIKASKKAETEIAEQIRTVLANHGTIVDDFVEEVREV